MPVRWIPGESYLGNSYLIGGVLVDAGVLPISLQDSFDQIEEIVLTHCHFDHIAYLKEIAGVTGARVSIHRLDAKGLSSETASLAMHFGARSPGLVPDRELEEGSRVGDLVVLHTPGHTPGSICLYREKDQALISGDTVFTDGGFGRFDFPGGSRDALLASLRRLADLEVEELYPGHGLPTLHGGNAHIAGALELLNLSYG
jgi:glyoxylase-like metal-dependent hydrolase (beta-lactamase superfamily II)